MPPWSRFNEVVTWRRISALAIVATSPSGSLTVVRQPDGASSVVVTVEGTPSGAVTISGTVDGVADSEGLTWTGTAGWKTTRRRFSAISSITSALTNATEISARYAGEGGEPRPREYDLRTGIPVGRSTRRARDWGTPPPGAQQDATEVLRVCYEETWEPRENDVVVYSTGERWKVAGVTRPPRLAGHNEWKVELAREQG